VPILLDCLIWRSRTTENGMRRVNYYVKHLLADEEGDFSKTLFWITSIKDPKLVCHPVVAFVADLVWGKVAYRSFLYGRSWHFLTLVVFLISQSVLEHLNAGDKNEAQRIAVFACRMFIYVLSMPQLVYCHTRDSIEAYKKGDTIKVKCFVVPRYLRMWQNSANLMLTICLVVMLLNEPILWCYEYQHGKLFHEMCPERDYMRLFYTIFSMFAMFLYYVLLVDLTIISTRISAFALACVRMVSEVGLTLGALFVSILTFSSAASVLKQTNPDFAGIDKSAFALFRMVIRAYDAKKYESLENDPTLLVVVFLFLIVTVIFFLNMLVAQLSCAYSSVYEDMVGYARLERAEKVVEVMPSVPKKRWVNFLASLRLNKRLEFNQGDIGIAGGIHMAEAANMNPTTIDMIKRFGGSTSVEIQWPEDEDDGDADDDKFERMEKLIQRALKRVTRTTGKGKGQSGGGTGTGTGSGSGTHSKSSSSNGGEDQDV